MKIPKRSQLAAVVALVEAEYELLPRQLYGRCRERHVCDARQISWLLMKKNIGANNSQIARHFKMHSSTVLSGIRRLLERVGDDELQAVIHTLSMRIP